MNTMVSTLNAQQNSGISSKRRFRLVSSSNYTYEAAEKDPNFQFPVFASDEEQFNKVVRNLKEILLDGRTDSSYLIARNLEKTLKHRSFTSEEAEETVLLMLLGVGLVPYFRTGIFVFKKLDLATLVSNSDIISFSRDTCMTMKIIKMLRLLSLIDTQTYQAYETRYAEKYNGSEKTLLNVPLCNNAVYRVASQRY